MADFEVQGLQGVLQALQSLPREVASKNGGPARAALAKGAALIRDSARAKAPVASGHLRDSIIMHRDRRPQSLGVNERYRVGVRGGAKQYVNNKQNRRAGRAGQAYEGGGNAYYWRFLEFGTEKMAAKPFLRPAFEENKEKAIDVISAALWKGIERLAKKVAKGR